MLRNVITSQEMLFWAHGSVSRETLVQYVGFKNNVLEELNSECNIQREPILAGTTIAAFQGTGGSVLFRLL